MSGIQEIYRHHHSQHRKGNFSILKDERASFLSKNIGEGKQVLDLGCRDGALTSTFSKNNNVLGIDIDETLLEKARINAKIETKHADLNGDWGLPSSHFDFVVAGEVIEHLYYPEIVLNKIYHVLKDGGTLLGSVPNAFSLINRFRLLLGNKKNTPLMDPTHINQFERGELEHLLTMKFRGVELFGAGNYQKLDKFFPGYFSFIILFKATK